MKAAHIYTKPEAVTRPVCCRRVSVNTRRPKNALWCECARPDPRLVSYFSYVSLVSSCHVAVKQFFNPSQEEHLRPRCGGKKLSDNS